jgi:ribose transport system substrate-binding protein
MQIRWGFSVILLIAGLGSLLVLNGCSRSSSKTIVIIPETTAQELWETEHAGVEAAVLGTRWKIYWNGPSSEDEVDKQIDLVQKATDENAGGIVLSPDHAVALTTVIRRALSSHIPVVITGSPLPILHEAGLHQILNDNEESGRLAAERLATIFDGKGTVAILGFNPDIVSTVQVTNALSHEIQQNYPNIHIVARPKGSFRLGEMEEQTEEILRASPQLSAIVTIGITSTRGAYIALKSTDRSKAVKLIGCDQDLDLMYYLRRGEIDSIVVQNTYEMGYKAIESIQSQYEGRSFPDVTRVKPVLVTKGNIDTDAIQRLLTMDWRPVR